MRTAIFTDVNAALDLYYAVQHHVRCKECSMVKDVDPETEVDRWVVRWLGPTESHVDSWNRRRQARDAKEITLKELLRDIDR